ncbi:MAG: hypothetical protein HC851_11045 [Acaryochloris sp. RU_4_1]|nr:hypothetical protein [Acaryochloris sp. RU_4_1]NJR54806.1 hypothetical protein [Acaryochloris sp. CRU_2_0]
MNTSSSVSISPNVLNLQGYNTEILLSSSITGTLQLTYTNRGQTLSFSGSEILSEDSQLGQMVTVSLSDKLALSDFESLTLLIPTVNLTPDTRETSVQTIAIFNRRSRIHRGQSQTYMTLCLSGTAQQIEF